MTEVAQWPAAGNTATRTAKDMTCLLRVLHRYLETCDVDRDKPVLVLGGGEEDVDILTASGFKQLVMSNINSPGLALDAENIALSDDSYDVVFAHAVLHHC